MIDSYHYFFKAAQTALVTSLVMEFPPRSLGRCHRLLTHFDFPIILIDRRDVIVIGLEKMAYQNDLPDDNNQRKGFQLCVLELK